MPSKAWCIPRRWASTNILSSKRNKHLSFRAMRQQQISTGIKIKMDPSLQFACTVTGSLGFVLRVSQIFGVAPLRFESVREGWRIRVSRTAGLYGKIIISLLCVLTTISLGWDFSLDHEVSFHSRTPAYAILSIGDASVISAVLLAAVYSGTYRMQKIITCLVRIQKTNAELREYGQFRSYEKIQLFITVWSLISIINLAVDCGILYYEIHLRHGNLIMGSIFASCYTEAAVMKVLTLQLALILTTVLSSFNYLNDYMQNLLQQINESENEKSPNSLPGTVHRLRYLYCCLCDVVHLMDDTHGIVLVARTLCFFLHLIITPYNFITRLSGNDADFYKALIQFFWIAYQGMDLIIIVEPCHQTHRQMNRTKQLISQLMLVAPREQYALNSELELFYKHLMSIEALYAPMKMFKLQRTLIASILGSITTYLVVAVKL